MKLAEALIERKGLQKKIERLSERLVNNAKTQEGEVPSENPGDLIQEIDRTNEELTRLIIGINKTNALVYLAPNEVPVVTLADALAKRDGIAKRRNILAKFAEAATEPVRAYGRLEVKYVRTMNIPDIQRRIDALAAEYNALDAKIQGKNWDTDLVVD